MELLVPEVWWSNYWNSGSDDHRRIGAFAYCIANTKIVVLATADRSVSPTIISLSMKYFSVSFQDYAPYMYVYVYIYILFTISTVSDIKF